MGTNENRDRKLAHHEKPIWRKAFEEAMKHTSIEGATRNAWKAVDAWNNAGAFNEEQSGTPRPNELPIQVEYWAAIVAWAESLASPGDLDLLRELILDANEDKISVAQFRNELRDVGA